jgi:hypothetical protein
MQRTRRMATRRRMSVRAVDMESWNSVARQSGQHSRMTKNLGMPLCQLRSLRRIKLPPHAVARPIARRDVAEAARARSCQAGRKWSNNPGNNERLPGFGSVALYVLYERCRVVNSSCRMGVLKRPFPSGKTVNRSNESISGGFRARASLEGLRL